MMMMMMMISMAAAGTATAAAQLATYLRCCGEGIALWYMPLCWHGTFILRFNILACWRYAQQLWPSGKMYAAIKRTRFSGSRRVYDYVTTAACRQTR